MNLAVTVTLDGLVRALRRVEHGIAEREAKPRPDLRDMQRQPDRDAPADEQQRKGGR